VRALLTDEVAAGECALDMVPPCAVGRCVVPSSLTAETAPKVAHARVQWVEGLQFIVTVSSISSTPTGDWALRDSVTTKRWPSGAGA